jgi:hypothetical protein
MKRHRKLLEQLDEMYVNQAESKRVSSHFTKFVDTGLMDSVITKNIIENEESHLIAKMSYRSGEISEYDGKKDAGLISVLDVSLYSQFKVLSKQLAKDEAMTMNELKGDKTPINIVNKDKKQGISPIRKRIDPLGSANSNRGNSTNNNVGEKSSNKIIANANKANNLKSIENLINTIKSKYNKLKVVETGKDQRKSSVKIIKPEIETSANINIKTINKAKKDTIGIANFKHAILKTKREVSQRDSSKDNVSLGGIFKKLDYNNNINNNINSNNFIKNAMSKFALRKGVKKDSIGSTLNSVRDTNNTNANNPMSPNNANGQKPVYNINFNLNLNLNVNKPESKAPASGLNTSRSRDKIKEKLNKLINIPLDGNSGSNTSKRNIEPLTDRTKSVDKGGLSPFYYYKDSLSNNIKNLYYKQYPSGVTNTSNVNFKKSKDNRDNSLTNRSHSRSIERYRKVTTRGDYSNLVTNESKKAPVSKIFNLKNRMISSSPGGARKNILQQPDNSYNHYYSKAVSGRDQLGRSINTQHSYNNSINNGNDKGAGANSSRRPKGDARPLSINLNNYKLDLNNISRGNLSSKLDSSRDKNKRKVFK